jgi:thiamine-monophosphate kinase
VNNGTPLSELGLFGLIEHIQKQFKPFGKSTLTGTGEDAAVIRSDGTGVFGASMLLEGIHFDLVYSPLQHLGYKAVVVAISDILAMNGRPEQIVVNLGLSNKMVLESVEALMGGVMAACEDYKIDIAGFKPSASLTGLTISVSVTGTVNKNNMTLRSSAKPTDIICVSGDLGAALMGLHILEREKRVLKSSGTQEPQFGNNDYVLKRQLKPEARIDIIDKLKEKGIQPTAMTCIKEGLATALLLICKASGTGCRIYENKIPLHQITLKAAQEMNFNPLVAALNGGEDYELLFTISISDYEKHKDNLPETLAIVGYIAESDKACRIITTADQEVDIKAQGWGNKE